MFVGRASAQLQARQVAHVVVADHATLGRSRCARGVDEAGEFPRGGFALDRGVVLATVLGERRQRQRATQLGVRGATGQHLFHVWQPIGNGRDALDVAGFANHQRRPGIGNLVPQELSLERSVDRHTDGAKLVDGKPAQNRVDVVVEHGDHSLTRLHTQCRKRMGQTRRLTVHFSVSVTLTREIEQNPLGVFGYSAFKRCDDRILLAERPCVGVADACHVKSSKPRRKTQQILYTDDNSRCRY